jgi:hypothetical protein
MNHKQAPSSINGRMEVLKENAQGNVFVKLTGNTKGVNTEEPIYIERLIKKGALDYVKVNHKLNICVSNIEEISDTKNNILWQKKKKKKKKTKRNQKN